jgi:hypothetical protein
MHLIELMTLLIYTSPAKILPHSLIPMCFRRKSHRKYRLHRTCTALRVSERETTLYITSIVICLNPLCVIISLAYSFWQDQVHVHYGVSEH